MLGPFRIYSIMEYIYIYMYFFIYIYILLFFWRGVTTIIRALEGMIIKLFLKKNVDGGIVTDREVDNLIFRDVISRGYKRHCRFKLAHKVRLFGNRTGGRNRTST